MVSTAVDKGPEIHVSQRLCTLLTTAKPKVEPEVLARRWGIGFEAAKTTFHHTFVKLSAVEDMTSAASILAHAGEHVYQSEVKTR